MAAQILSFAAARAREPLSRDWSSQELAEFYRVESALLQAGLQLEGERGLSDEGDPWFVFCRVDTGEVFIHFARVDGWYVVDGAAFGAPARGRDFGALVRDLIASHPLAAARRPGTNVMLHPAALLIALVGAAFFHSAKAHAAEPGEGAAAAPDVARAPERRGFVFNVGGPAPPAGAEGGRAVALDAYEVAAVLTGVAIGLRDLDAAAAAQTGGRDASEIPPTITSIAAAGARPDAASDTAVVGRAMLSTLGGLSGADARAALTVMAVFHDLAQGATTGAPPAATVGSDASTSLASPAAATPTLHLADAPAPAPMLLVHLATGPLPQIEALAIVQADGALAHVPTEHVVHVDQLPSTILDLIKAGEIIPPAPSLVSTPTPDGGDAPVSPAYGGGSGSGPSGGAPDVQPGGPVGVGSHPHGGHDTAAGAPTTSAAEPPFATTALGSPPAPDHSAGDGAGVTSPPTSTGSTAPVMSAHDTLIDAAVLAFVAAVADVQVMISGHDVVFYDPVIMGVLHVGDTLDSITWRLEDGSSVSLVGTASELHALHGLG